MVVNFCVLNLVKRSRYPPNIICTKFSNTVAQKAAWLQKSLLDLRLPSQPLVMMEDKGAIALVKNPLSHSGQSILTFVDNGFHFIRDGQENGSIELKYY